MEQARWDLAAEMFKRAGDNGGWTMEIHEVRDPDHGYSVGGSTVPEWIIPDFRNMPGPFVVQQISRHIDIIDRAGREMSGGWVREDGVLVLDSPDILTDREAAIALGRERGQEAIYCLDTDETITL